MLTSLRTPCGYFSVRRGGLQAHPRCCCFFFCVAAARFCPRAHCATAGRGTLYSAPFIVFSASQPQTTPQVKPIKMAALLNKVKPQVSHRSLAASAASRRPRYCLFLSLATSHSSLHFLQPPPLKNSVFCATLAVMQAAAQHERIPANRHIRHSNRNPISCISNGYNELLESRLTCTKQTTDVHSNRYKYALSFARHSARNFQKISQIDLQSRLQNEVRMQ